MADPDKIEIKNKQPSLRRMATDYYLMFQENGLVMLLGWGIPLAVVLIVWFVTPSANDPNANIVLRVIALFAAFFHSSVSLCSHSCLLRRFLRVSSFHSSSDCLK
jgi:hypothetical protein